LKRVNSRKYITILSLQKYLSLLAKRRKNLKKIKLFPKLNKNQMMKVKRKIMKLIINQVIRRNNRRRNQLLPRKEQRCKKKLKKIPRNQPKQEKLKRMMIMIMKERIIKMTMKMMTQAV